MRQITEVTTFTTSDGKKWDNYQEAAHHQLWIEAKEAWMARFDDRHGPDHVATMAEFFDEIKYPAKNLHRALRAWLNCFPKED